MTVTTKRADGGLRADVSRVSGALGAEIRGVELRKLDKDGFAALNALLIEHQVIFLPGQHLSADEHRDFAMRFGTPEIHPFIPKLDDAHPEIVVLSADEGYVADVWHTDVTFDASPPICSVLQMLKKPAAGGDTMWANQQLAYERLSAPMKAFLAGLTAIHSAANYGHPERQAEHPVVRRHPVTGKPSLFVNEQFTRRIPQLSREESKALLTHLYAHCTQPGFTCRYAWEEGTIAIWDNRCTQHYAVNDYEGERKISRVTILGDLPEPAFDTRVWTAYAPPRKSAASAGRDRD